ncbi:MAG: DNA-methyltransferase [Bacteroidia bacterium]
MKNKLFYGDNLEVLRKYVAAESVDLCYIDPPFNSKRNYNQIYNNVGKEDVAQAQAFVDTWTWDAMANEGFDEILNNKMGNYTHQSINLIVGMEKILGKGSLLAYLVSMTQRITEIHRVLKPTGSFYLHCDPTASHYLKLVCDGIFCPKGGDFQNELIWSYKRYTAASNRFQRLHDVIFFYIKQNPATFNEPREQYGEKSGKADSHYKQDEEGKWFRWQKRKGQDAYKIYLNPKGKRLGDVWEVPIINASAKERLGYPTQKPEALLERIIEASSNEGDVVLDAYCGCGTTIAVAEKLKRKWIGVDITYQSISLILKRLEDTFGGDFTKDVADKETKKILQAARVELNGVPQDMEAAIALANRKDDRLRKEFEKWFVLSFSNNRAAIHEKKGGDGGIDGIAYMMDSDEKGKQLYKQVIFSVKSNKTLSPTVVRDLYGTVEREKAAVGYLLTLYPMPNLVKEASKYGQYENKMFGHSYPKIVVISVQELLDGERMNLPTVMSVLKSAERKVTVNETIEIEFEEESI